MTVELWMDYQSTDCAAVAEKLEPELRTRIAAAIRAELHDLAALGDESVVAATRVRCVADQDGPAWFVHDVLAVSAQGAGAGSTSRRTCCGSPRSWAWTCGRSMPASRTRRSRRRCRDETARAGDGIAAGPTS